MLERIFIILVIASCIDASPTPEQIHIAFGGPTSTLVAWASLEKPASTGIVYLGTNLDGLDRLVTATTTEFKDDSAEFDKNKKRTWIYKATLDNLQAGTVYYYRVENDGNRSPIYNFTQLGKPDQLYNFVVFGDMGNTEAHSWSHIQTEANQGKVDLLFHNGDFAYDMHNDESRYGDTFFNLVQPVAAYYPYMAIPGNHEAKYNFSNYVARFNMPNSKMTSNHYYSFDLGLTHFIMLSTEFYYFTRFGEEQVQYQYEWLVQDLQKAVHNRDSVPWIVVTGHRPMYCSALDPSFDCRHKETRIRVGMPDTHKYGLEDLFDSFGVDLLIWAHEHDYERLYPIYNRITGCADGQTLFRPDPAPWSAFRTSDFGYSHMKIVNRTHLYFDFMSIGEKGDDPVGKIVDSFWVIRDKHEPYSKSQRALLNGTYVPLDYGMEEEMNLRALNARNSEIDDEVEL